MTVIKLYLILKCSILILKFSHVLHIHNKKGLYLKFSNYHFFSFMVKGSKWESDQNVEAKNAFPLIFY